jgi:VanZ family protein
MKFTLFIPGIIWFIISTILLALPGNDLPQTSFFNFPYFDKIVHFFMFFLLTFFFSLPFTLPQHRQAIKQWLVSIAIYVLAYGVLMEFVQKYWVQGRSFDLTDIFFDGMGSLAGMLVIIQFYVKK